MTYVTPPSERFHHRPEGGVTDTASADRLHAFAILYNTIYGMRGHAPLIRDMRIHALQPKTRI